MRYFEQEGIKFQDFDSITEFNDYLAKTPVNRHFQGQELSSNANYGGMYGGNWHGSRDYAEAQDLLARGWQVSAARIAAKLPVQTTQETSNRTKPTYGVVGGQASVPRYLQGIPTNMIDRTPVPAKQKIIVLTRNICFPAKRKKSPLLFRDMPLYYFYTI